MRNWRRRINAVTLGVALGTAWAAAGDARAQSEGPHWQRTQPVPMVVPAVFHSNHVINLPTAETWQRGMFQFEILHRFLNPLSSGYETFYGLDGPVNLRLGLGWAPSPRTTITLARTNLNGNVDLQLKWKAFHGLAAKRPSAVALILGAAWDTNSPMYASTHHRAWQFYAQAPLNARWGRLALGVAPSYVYNSIPESDEIEHSLTLGLYAQYYLSSLLSILAECNVIEPGYYYEHHPMAFGIELETGGHFFKIVFTNTGKLNPSQYLPGATLDAGADHWQLGFNITRLLRF
jgi:hypothetical protein